MKRQARYACLALGFLGALVWHPPRSVAEGYPNLPPFDLQLERVQAEPVTADDVPIEPRLARKPLRFGAAARAECPVPIPKTVSVDVGRGPINYSSEIGLKELRQAAAGHYGGPVVGAYQVNIGYAADVDQTPRELDPGRFCVEPDHVILNVQITQTIHIPREFVADKCLSALALEHEKKQAQAAAASMDAIQPKLLSVLRLAMRIGFLASGRMRPRTNSCISTGTRVIDSSAAPPMAKVLVSASGLNSRPSWASSVNTGRNDTVMTARLDAGGVAGVGRSHATPTSWTVLSSS
jgi:hypothetical protein